MRTKVYTAGRTLHRDAQEREHQRHFGAVGLRQLPFVLLHLAMRLFSGQRMALGGELADVRLHQAGICDPVGHGDHGCDDCEAEERGVGCCVRLSGDLQVATPKVAENDAI